MKEFFELMKKLSDKDPTPYWKFMIKQYVDSARAYHNLQHIVQGWDEFNEIKKLKIAEFKEVMEPPKILRVKFSWGNHDLIYYTGHLDKNGNPVLVKDNEEKSALYSYQMAKELELSDEFAQESHDEVMVTKHDRAPITLEQKLIADTDLSILGKPEQIFWLYDGGIRQEYYWVPEDLYKSARAGVLQSFLNKPFIYNTEYFKNKYEGQARRNIEKALFNLSIS
ncbi:hypothetical protein HY837_01235 [archaeon]|nr:hypothetical protein [archaeon]